MRVDRVDVTSRACRSQVRDHREKLVRRSLLVLLPTLARHCARDSALTQAFTEEHLERTLDHLLNVPCHFQTRALPNPSTSKPEHFRTRALP